MNRIDRVAVIIPAADEQELIGACLDAVSVAAARVAGRVRVEVIVVLDRCTEATEVAARAAGATCVPISARCVGAARRAGSARALAGGSERLWLAHTDADSAVPDNWLVDMLAAAGSGAGLVLGTVVPGAGLSVAARSRWEADHDLHDGHRHVHGANLGIRADVYLAIGGWAALACDEDVALVDAAVRAGTDIRRLAGVPVVTSTRGTGRVSGGFADYLRAADPGPPAEQAVARDQPKAVSMWSSNAPGSS